MKTTNPFGVYHNPPLIVDYNRTILINPKRVKVLSKKITSIQIKSHYKIDVFVDGLFIFRPKCPITYSDIEQITNLFFFCLYLEVKFFLPKMKVSLYEIIHYAKNGKIRNYGINPLNKLFYEARDPQKYKSHPILDWKNKTRFEIKSSAIKSAARLVENLLHSDIDPTIFNLINKSQLAYQNYDFNMALAFNWLSAEYLLSKTFDNYISDNRKIINKHRKDTLESYFISEKIEIMNLTGTISIDLYKRITSVRKKRNKYFHELRPVSKEDAEESIELTAHLLKELFGIQLTFRYGLFMISN